jgi:hypothetical protein
VLGSEGRRSLGRPRSRCEANIKINLTDIARSGMDWTNLRTQGIIVISCNTTTNIGFLKMAENPAKNGESGIAEMSAL